MRISNAILRGVPGAFLLQSGYGKLGMDAESTEGLKQFASTGVPQFADWDSQTFAKFIAGTELALGTALLGRGALAKRATARHRATGK